MWSTCIKGLRKTLKASLALRPSLQMKPETLILMSMKHFQLHYMPQLLASTINFFFYSSKNKGENESRHFLGHSRHPAYNFPKCFSNFFLMVSPTGRYRREALRRKAALGGDEPSPVSGALGLVRYPLVRQQSFGHSCRTNSRAWVQSTLDRGGKRHAFVLEGDTSTHIQLQTGKRILMCLQSLP